LTVAGARVGIQIPIRSRNSVEIDRYSKV